MKIDGDRFFMWCLGTAFIAALACGIAAFAGLVVVAWRLALS